MAMTEVTLATGIEAMSEDRQFDERRSLLQRRVDALVIQGDDDFQNAAEISRTIALYIKRVGEVFDPICATAHTAWKTATTQRKTLLDPAEELKRAVGDKMAAYEQAVEAARREAEEKARVERERLEAEARAVAEAEERRLRAIEEDRLLAAAAQAEDEGDVETAERLISEPVVVPTVAVMPVFTPPPAMAVPAAKATGISFSWTYSAALKDIDKLIAAAFNGDSTARSLLTMDQARANGVARAVKDEFRVPGVELVKTRTQATRT